MQIVMNYDSEDVHVVPFLGILPSRNCKTYKSMQYIIMDIMSAVTPVIKAYIEVVCSNDD